MPRSDDPLLRALTLGEDNGESMDVLLQLTLPIVLILAFVVATEVTSLQQNLNAMSEDYQTMAEAKYDMQQELQVLTEQLQDSDSGRLLQQLDLTLITLQQQLLLQTTDEVLGEHSDALGLSRYAASAPGVTDLLYARDIEPAFQRSSAALAEMFNGATAQALSEQRLRAEVLERYRQKIDRFFEQGKLPPFRRSDLKVVRAESRNAFHARLKGRLEQIQAQVNDTQLQLILAWVSSPVAEQAVQQRSGSLWRTIQSSIDETAVRRGVEDFVNLKTAALLQRLRALAVPLLDSTCIQVAGRPCGEIQ